MSKATRRYLLETTAMSRVVLVRPKHATPRVHIIGGVARGCGTALVVDGAAVEVDGLEAIETPIAIEVRNNATVKARRIKHNP